MIPRKVAYFSNYTDSISALIVSRSWIITRFSLCLIRVLCKTSGIFYVSCLRSKFGYLSDIFAQSDLQFFLKSLFFCLIILLLLLLYKISRKQYFSQEEVLQLVSSFSELYSEKYNSRNEIFNWFIFRIVVEKTSEMKIFLTTHCIKSLKQHSSAWNCSANNITLVLHLILN